MNPEDTVIEQLADHAHASWSHWMRYLFAQSTLLPDGSVTIPSALVTRWQRQMQTPYQDLSEQEKQSDREQARHLLPILQACRFTSPEEGKS